MSNKNIINQSIRLYFQGEDWLSYLKKEVRKSKRFKKTLKNVIKDSEEYNEK